MEKTIKFFNENDFVIITSKYIKISRHLLESLSNPNYIILKRTDGDCLKIKTAMSFENFSIKITYPFLKRKSVIIKSKKLVNSLPLVENLSEKSRKHMHIKINEFIINKIELSAKTNKSFKKIFTNSIC